MNRWDPMGLDSQYDDPMQVIANGFGAIFEPLVQFLVGGRRGSENGRAILVNEPGKIGGVVGGVGETVLLRQADMLEKYPTGPSRAGMEHGAGLVPILDPVERLYTGETISGYKCSRVWAAIELFLDVGPTVLEAKALATASRTTSTTIRTTSSLLRQVPSTEIRVLTAEEVSQFRRCYQLGGDIVDGGSQLQKLEARTLKIVRSGSTKSVLSEMPRPHEHHILFKKGIGKTQQELVDEGQAILRKYGIDPMNGPENLMQAPNIKGQHTLENLEEVVQQLREADAAGAMKEDIVDVLVEMGKKAARRR